MTICCLITPKNLLECTVPRESVCVCECVNAIGNELLSLALSPLPSSHRTSEKKMQMFLNGHACVYMLISNKLQLLYRTIISIKFDL